MEVAGRLLIVHELQEDYFPFEWLPLLWKEQHLQSEKSENNVCGSDPRCLFNEVYSTSSTGPVAKLNLNNTNSTLSLAPDDWNQ